MRCRRDLSAIAAFAALGWQREAAAPLPLAGRAALYLLILAIFREIWRATPLAELGRPDLTADAMLWYLAVTEWIVFAAGLPYREVEAEIQSGDIAMALLRPLPYGIATLARWVGASAYDLVMLGLVGFAGAALLTGTWPLGLAAAPGLLLAAALGTFLILLCQLQLGYAAAWLGSAAPPFWVWQKLNFVLGGLLIPLTLYPAPWRGLAEASPFAAMLFGPGSLALDPGLSHLAWVLGDQIFWLALLGAMTFLIDRAAAARFIAEGV